MSFITLAMNFRKRPKQLTKAKIIPRDADGNAPIKIAKLGWYWANTNKLTGYSGMTNSIN